MGWWKINCAGGISESRPPSGADGSLLNAVPGRDTIEDHYGGDGPADIMQAAIDEISVLWEKTWGRSPYPEELDGVWAFITGKYRVKEKTQ